MSQESPGKATAVFKDMVAALGEESNPAAAKTPTAAAPQLHAQSPPTPTPSFTPSFAPPELGSFASSARAWRPGSGPAHPGEEAGPLGAPPLPRVLEPAACQSRLRQPRRLLPCQVGCADSCRAGHWLLHVHARAVSLQLHACGHAVIRLLHRRLHQLYQRRLDADAGAAPSTSAPSTSAPSTSAPPHDTAALTTRAPCAMRHAPCAVRHATCGRSSAYAMPSQGALGMAMTVSGPGVDMLTDATSFLPYLLTYLLTYLPTYLLTY